MHAQHCSPESQAPPGMADQKSDDTHTQHVQLPALDQTGPQEWQLSAVLSGSLHKGPSRSDFHPG